MNDNYTRALQLDKTDASSDEKKLQQKKEVFPVGHGI